MAKNGSSATSGRVISFAENRTFRSFVLLYALMSLMILALLGTLYFRASKNEMLSAHRLAMQLEGESYLPRLVKWMQGESPRFPVDPAYETAFFLDGKRVGGALAVFPETLAPGIHAQQGRVYLVIPMGSYGLKNGQTVMMTVDDGLWKRAFWRFTLWYGGLLFVLLLLIGVGLSHLFLRPMKEAVALLDSFIKDTTHELNTPVTAILTNVERLQTDAFDEKQRRAITRIETAARTIDTIYEDLIFLLLRKEGAAKDVRIDMETLIRERLDYFQTRFEAKHMVGVLELTEPFSVEMDRKYAERLIDNLLSNAVKYGDPDTLVTVTVGAGWVCIANVGPVIPEAKLPTIFRRFVRADESRGGFGIGLHLVARIAGQYGIAVAVDSQQRRTRFTLTWPRYTPRSP